MENITTSEHYKTLPEAQDFKEQIVLSLKEIDMKLGQLSEQRHRLMAAMCNLNVGETTGRQDRLGAT